MAKDMKVVILAAGLGTRMKSSVPKVLHLLGRRPIIEYVLNTVRSLDIDDIISVIGHKASLVKDLLGDVNPSRNEIFKGVKIIEQKRLLGSADALKETKEFFKNFKGDILVLYGDEPLLRPETLKRLIKEHRLKNNFCTLLSTRLANPTGYGRVVRNDSGNIAKIVEETEATVFEKSIVEINVGVYCFKNENLFSILEEVKNDNKKGEYFLTDVISIANRRSLKVDSIVTDESDEGLGINSRRDLAEAEKILQKRILARLMDEGVTIVDPITTHIDHQVSIGEDSTIYPHTVIEKDVKIGKNCQIGPFARIRPGCELKDGVEIGNFVELVRTKIGKDTKVKHHSYLGDTIIGENVNIGAGTITANYDGRGKYITKIDDSAFIGSGTILIAPVKIGRSATTGAGAVVTKNHDVPPKSVVIGIPARVLKKTRGRT